MIKLKSSTAMLTRCYEVTHGDRFLGVIFLWRARAHRWRWEFAGAQTGFRSLDDATRFFSQVFDCVVEVEPPRNDE